MSGASVWNPGGIIPSTANADNSYLSQRFIATQGQTVFNLTTFAYAPGTDSLFVEINGVAQYIGVDFTETSSGIVTLVAGVDAGDAVVIRGLVGSTGAQAAATSAALAQQAAIDAVAAYMSILGLSLPNLPLTIANGGTGVATKTEGFDALAPSTSKGDLIVFNGADNIRLAVGVNGTVLMADSTTASGLKYGAVSPSMIRSPRTANTILGVADLNTLIETTGANTYAQTISPVATLTNGWFVITSNAGTGYTTLTPNGAEKIVVNGVDRTSWVLWPGEMGWLFCDGVKLYYYCIKKGEITTTISSPAASVTFSTGMAYRRRMSLSLENVAVDTATVIELKLNSASCDRAQGNNNNNGTVQSLLTSVLRFGVNSIAANATGINRLYGGARIDSGVVGTRINYDDTYAVTAGSNFGHTEATAFWASKNESNLSTLTLDPGVGNNLTAGTFILRDL